MDDEGVVNYLYVFVDMMYVCMSARYPLFVLCKLTQVRSPRFPLVSIFQHSQGLGYLLPFGN